MKKLKLFLDVTKGYIMFIVLLIASLFIKVDGRE